MTTRTRRRSWWRKAAEAIIDAIDVEVTIEPVRDDRGEREPSPQLRKAIIARDKSKCVYCSRKVWGRGLHIDHRYPWSKGGRTTYTNLQVTCWQCNKEKGDMTDREYRRLRERQAWAGRR